MRSALPIAYDRSLSLHLYTVSHGLLLLRSGKTKEHSSRIDILFTVVRWMALPAWLEGIRIERGVLSDIPLPLTAKIEEESQWFCCLFQLLACSVGSF